MKPGAGPSIGTAAAVVALAVAWACVPKTTHRQTDVMAKTGGITVSAPELRAMVNALADRFADQIEQTADQVAATAKDPAVQKACARVQDRRRSRRLHRGVPRRPV